MYKKMILATVVALFAAMAVHAQTADEILNKYYTLMGGVENHAKIKTVYMEVGKDVETKMGKGKLTFKIWTEYPSKRRLEVLIDIDTIHEKQIIICTEAGGWVVSDSSKLDEIPEDQVEDAVNNVKQNSMFEKDRLDFQKKFTKIEFAGKERTNGKTTYKLRMTSKDDKEAYYYFDNEKYTLVKRKMTIDGQDGNEHELEMLSTDLKPVDGFMVAHTFEMFGDGESMDKRTLNKIEINKPIDPKMFEKPDLPLAPKTDAPKKADGQKK